MPFNNSANKCKFIGYPLTDIIPVENNDYAIEFPILVKRANKIDEKQYHDIIIIYVSKPSTVAFCNKNISKGTTVQVSGELRVWFDKTFKICADEVVIRG